MACGGRLTIALYTLRHIAAGEELTFDYSSVTESEKEFRRGHLRPDAMAIPHHSLCDRVSVIRNWLITGMSPLIVQHAQICVVGETRGALSAAGRIKAARVPLSVEPGHARQVC